MSSLIEKTCTKCKLVKLIINFTKAFNNRRNKSYYRSICKQCRADEEREWRKNNRELYNQRRREWYRRNPIRSLDIDLQGRYKISYQEFMKMVDEQNNQCGICNVIFKEPYGAKFGIKRDTCIDHNHETGSIRGILCAKCNRSLGWYERHQQQVNRWLKTNPSNSKKQSKGEI